MSNSTTLAFGPFADSLYDVSVQLREKVYRRSEELFDHWQDVNDALGSSEDVYSRQADIRAAALAALGGLPESTEPLQPELRGTVRADGFTVEKVIFQSLPGVFVTANLYLPADTSTPGGAVLFLCGHAEAAKAYPRYQAVCARLARNGLVALAVDPIGQGERKSYLDPSGAELVAANTVEHTYAGTQCWWRGTSIARYFVHDARRAIDYLCTRPEVDPRRIGVTGNSGGGTQATWLMMAEPRLAAAAPGTFVTTRRAYLRSGQAQDAEQVAPGGTQLGIGHEDFLIAMAPRPVLVLAVDYDFFPIEGTLESVARARRIFQLLGNDDNLALVRSPNTHGYQADLAQAAVRFFVRHLGGGVDVDVDDSTPQPIAADDLRCTDSGQVLMDRPECRRVFDLGRDEQTSHEQQSTPATDDPAAHTRAAHTWLSQRVHAHRRSSLEFFPRWLPTTESDGCTIRRVLWRSEADLFTTGCLVLPASGQYRSLTIAVLDRGTNELDDRRGWLDARLADGQAILAVDVRGVGATTPAAVNPRPSDGNYGTIYKLATDLLWLGDSLAAGRVFDVLRAVEFARQDAEIGLSGRPMRLLGSGLGSFYAYLATALDLGVGELELETPPPDPGKIVATRYYDVDQSTECVIPGMVSGASLVDLRPLVASRLRE